MGFGLVLSRTAPVAAHEADTTAHAASAITAAGTDGDDAQEQLDNKVSKATYDANTILKADTDNTPAALTVGEQTLLGRITAGVVAALTPAQVRTLLDLANLYAPIEHGVSHTTGWYFAPEGASSNSTPSVAAQLTLQRMAIGKACSIDRIGARVVTGGTAGSVVRLGVYGSDVKGFPSARLLDAGTIDGTSATRQEITISQALTPGVYWLVAACQGAPITEPIMRLSLTAGAGLLTVDSLTNALDSTVVGLYSTGVAGALPNPVVPTSGSSTAIRVTARFV